MESGDIVLSENSNEGLRWHRGSSAMSTISGEFILKMGKGEFHGRAADVEVFHRRDADDRGGIDRVFSVRDGGDVEDGIRLGTPHPVCANCF